MTLFTILWLAGIGFLVYALLLPDEHPDKPGMPVIFASYGFGLILASVLVFIHQL